MGSTSKIRRRKRSWLLPVGCCIAIPLVAAVSYVRPIMKYLQALDLEHARYLDVARVGLVSTSSAIDSAKRTVGKVVYDLVERKESSEELEFCDTNLPAKVESMDDVGEFNVNIEKVSVCVVVLAYEAKEHIDRVFSSVTSQTHKQIKIIAVDNGSTDGSKDVLQNLAKKHQNIKLVRLGQHVSEGQSYNVGISSCPASSTYVYLNNGVVTLEKDAVASMVSYAENLRVDVVLADFDVQSLSNGRKLTEENSYDMNQWSLLPAGSPFNVYSAPSVLRVAPMASRKLYRYKTLIEGNVQFPEGHYASAEEAFHWNVLAHATRISKIDRVLFHQVVKAVQQASALEYGGFFSNAHHVGNTLFGRGASAGGCLPSLANTTIAQSYFQWVEAAGWISRKQQSGPMQDKFDRLLKQTKHHWPQRSPLPTAYWNHMSDVTSSSLREGPSQVDLTIIMPTYNVNDLIGEVLKTMYAALERPGFSFEIFAIDDGSDDGTVDVLSNFQKDHSSNFFVMKTPSSNGGAGRARNLAIPLIEGRYVYFVDADDGYDFNALAESVSFATTNDYDVLIFPYESENVGPNNNVTTTGMMSADQKLWDKLPSEGNRTHEVQKELAYGLINYPWKQLTSSRIMRDEDVYFGPTKVHNDVQFHWTSIAASKNLHFYHTKVCSHRRFDASVRGQLTANKSPARMSVFASVSLTQRHLARQGVFDAEENEGPVFKKWLQFSRDVLNWASKRVPTELEKDYKARWKFMLTTLKEEKLKPSTFRNWPYWEM